jgi:starch phosphorylase
MKAVLNGGVIIGTLDGANIEIREQVGAENMFAFGRTAEEIASGQIQFELTPELQRVLDTITTLSPQLADILRTRDRYHHCTDFASYVETQRRAAETWTRRDDWTRMSILNCARSGLFSADRTVAEYARDIWEVAAVKV